MNYAYWINGVAVLGVVGMVALAPGLAGNGIDPTTVSSIKTASNSMAKTASRFMVVDHDNSKTCLVSLHRASDNGIHRVEPANCDGMPARLAAARTWRETPSGDARITDSAGTALMRLAVSDGFAWEVVEPRGVQLSFEAY
ncbi:hypothetical protein [Oricola sp.]|uniref:hypothetical protein n=1 Tax=Oricola sp. TaxID=1979950 RepID=UPI003BA8718D